MDNIGNFDLTEEGIYRHRYPEGVHGVLPPTGPINQVTDPNAMVGSSANMGTMTGLDPTMLDRIASYAAMAKDYMNKGSIPESFPILGGQGYGDFFMGQAPEYLSGRAGEGLIKGSGQAARLNLPAEAGLADTAFLGAGLGGIGGIGKNLLQHGAGFLDDLAAASARAELNLTSKTVDDILREVGMEDFDAAIDQGLSFKGGANKVSFDDIITNGGY